MLSFSAILRHAPGHMPNASREEALYYNAVARGANGDYGKLARFIRASGTWKNAYHGRHSLGAGMPDPATEWEKLTATGVTLTLADDDDYPARLREMPRPPFGIYTKGTIPTSSEMPFAIVGTRRATPEGKNIARRFAGDLAKNGFLIVSGLAFGIDAAAHAGCLDAKRPTVAVLAGGLDGIYPQTNDRLAENILSSGGGIISEYPLGEPPYGYRFLERNRIIGGLVRGVLVVEAPIGSGSLATARLALHANRDVFVVPGPIAHANFHGSHALIRQGAELVTCPEEILEAYGVSREATMAAKEIGASPEETLVLKALREVSAPVPVDKIITMTRLEPQTVNRVITTLLIEDMIKEKSGGYTI